MAVSLLAWRRLLRIYFLQHWFDLSDPAAEDAIYDSESMRRFAGVELGEDAVPDESTILSFRHLLEPEAGIVPQSSAATNEPATSERLERIARLRSQVETGAPGIGMR